MANQANDNDRTGRAPVYVGAWRRQIGGSRSRPSIVRRCLVPLADGKPCGRPATTYDAGRRHLVCWFHLPARSQRGRGEVH